MRMSRILALLLVFAASVAVAGEIYGTINDGNKPVAAGMKVDITVPGKTYTGETNKFGAYRIFVKEKGKCTLSVHAVGQAASAELFLVRQINTVRLDS